MTKREASNGQAGRYIALASEMVVMTLVGMFFGQVLGQKISPTFEILGIVFGTLGGFALGAYSIYKTVESLDKKTVIKIGKRLCPGCLRGIPEDLEECPHCGYRRKTEE